VSYRDLEDIMQERGVNVDHATLNLKSAVDRKTR
jgi:transposase-like protein